MASSYPVADAHAVDLAPLPVGVIEKLASPGSSTEWKRILFYQRSLFGAESGMVDTKGFYLAADGHRDPVSELVATYRALKTPGYKVPQRDMPAACAFPARLDFMIRKGLIKVNEIPERDCPIVDEWLAARTYQSMWMIFSSWYPDNPASMYGHTFLRFRRTDRESDLLDDAVNFAAQVANINDWLYPFKGLMGGYSGRFSLMPYHIKINEYNNIESRDLWEYRISADPAQIRRVLLSLLEVGPHGFDYYYLDENCSWVLLKLLETGDPSWNFMPDVKFWIVPVDTVRWVVTDPAVQVTHQSRISIQQKFRMRRQKLDAQASVIFDRIVTRLRDGKDASVLDGETLVLPGYPDGSEERRRLLDALLDWVDYRDGTGTDKLPGIARLRKDLLKARTAVKGQPDALTGLPEASNPANGHGTTHVRFGAFVHSEGAIQPAFSWTPALHELVAPPAGYAKGLEIAMFRMGAWWDNSARTPVVNDLGLFRIRALNPWNNAERSISWLADLGYTTDRGCPAHARGCQRTSVTAGSGLTTALPLASRFGDFYAAAFGTVEAGRMRRRDDVDRWFAAAGPRVDLWFATDLFRLEYDAVLLRSRDDYGVTATEAHNSVRLGLSLGKSADLRVSWTKAILNAGGHGIKDREKQSGTSTSVMAGWYF